MFKNYNTTQPVLPLNLEILIVPTDISVVIHEFVESLPEKVFDLFEKETGRPAYHPKMMVKINLCAYAQGVRSGRKIEDLVKDSIRMRWLARENEPSYRTINRFRTAILRESEEDPLSPEEFNQVEHSLDEVVKHYDEAIEKESSGAKRDLGRTKQLFKNRS